MICPLREGLFLCLNSCLRHSLSLDVTHRGLSVQAEGQIKPAAPHRAEALFGKRAVHPFQTVQNGSGALGPRWMTALLRPSLPADRAPWFTLGAAVAVADGLLSLGFPVGIKWPNALATANIGGEGPLFPQVAGDGGRQQVGAAPRAQTIGGAESTQAPVGRPSPSRRSAVPVPLCLCARGHRRPRGAGAGGDG